MELNVLRIGSGRPFILLHGFLGCGEGFKTLVSKMEGWQVWLPDLRNHGDSPWSDDFSIELMAQDVAAMIEKAHFEQNPVVSGYSLGGKVAMELALSHPHLVKGVVSFDMSPLALTPRFPDLFPNLAKVDLNQVHDWAEAKTALMEKLKNKDRVQYLMKNLVLDGEGRFRWRANIKILQENYHNLWIALARGRRYLGPSLFLLGGASDFVRPQDEEPIKEMFPQAEFQRIEDATHIFCFEKPREMMQMLWAWLKQTQLGDSTPWVL